MKIYPPTPLISWDTDGIIAATSTTMGQVPERPTKMRMETETAVRSIVCIDTEVTREMLEKALDILRGKIPEEDAIVHNIRFADAMEILMVSRRTLRHYLYSGYLDRGYGGGRRVIGVTRESLVRKTKKSRISLRVNWIWWPRHRVFIDSSLFDISRFSNHISYFPPLLKVLRRVSEDPPTHLPVSYPEYRLNVHRHLPLESEERDSRFSAAEYLHAWFCGKPRRHQVSMPNLAGQQP